LGQLIEARLAEVRQMTGQRIDMSASAYIRWLMDKDAHERGLDAEHAPATSVPAATATRKTKRR
jgi:hypothetical protein